MAETIALKNIRVAETATTWQDAIRIAAAPLVEAGSAEAGYVERMVQSVIELGPYIVLAPGFALAHAAPDVDVHESDLSVATFTDDIRFGSDNDPVQVVMCLACTDRESHISRLQGIAEKLLDGDDLVGRMRACATPLELYRLINA